MFEEPVYEYVKGSGWIIQTCEQATTTMYCGKLVRLERRYPKNDELYTWHFKGVWGMDNWIMWAQRNPVNTLRSLNYDHDPIDTRDYMTIIPL